MDWFRDTPINFINVAEVLLDGLGVPNSNAILMAIVLPNLLVVITAERVEFEYIVVFLHLLLLLFEGVQILIGQIVHDH
jgi:hypothetical protein